MSNGGRNYINRASAIFFALLALILFVGLQRFSVWLTRLTSATHNAYSEQLRQAFMKPWFAWVNIIVNRYRKLKARTLVVSSTISSVARPLLRPAHLRKGGYA